MQKEEEERVKEGRGKGERGRGDGEKEHLAKIDDMQITCVNVLRFKQT